MNPVRSSASHPLHNLNPLNQANPKQVSQTADFSTAACAPLVNRTHRAIRARAQAIQARKSRVRSLLLPLLVSSSMLVLVCYAIWSLFDGYELNPTGLPDASNQLFVLVLWFLPIVAGVLGAIWFRRSRNGGREDAIL